MVIPRARLIKSLTILMVVLLGALTANASASTAKRTSATSRTLIVDTSFILDTADPDRNLDLTGLIVDEALYSTLLTYNGSNVAKPVPLVASSYTASSNAETYTFILRKNIKFSDGDPLTSADVVFSFDRLINIEGDPSFLLDGITVSAPSKYTVVLRSDVPNPAIPQIVTDPSLGIVNAKVVMAHGGTDKPGASTTDKAEPFLNSTSAGSGPYILKSFSTTSEVILTKNPNYWGPAPKFSTVVFRNELAATQELNVQKGGYQIAVDLSSEEAESLKSERKLVVSEAPSPNVFFMFANENPAISSATANTHFQEAIRYAIDYSRLVELAGPGAIQAPGVIPSGFLGASPASAEVHTDLTKARAELAASGISHPTVTISFASNDTLNGLSPSTLAEEVQANLAKVGITVNLAGSPVDLAITQYRGGDEQLGLWTFGPDYPDPVDYLAFLPGGYVAVRAHWLTGSDPSLEALGNKMASTVNNSERGKLYQQIQNQLNKTGPFFPLVQAAEVLVSTKGLTHVDYNGIYTLNLGAIGIR
jgi:peptide/nickel transport system substrate-binding protein